MPAQDIARALVAPDVRDWIAKHGAAPTSMTQAEFARFVLSESAGQITKAAGIKPQ
jgi:tripartite-type tricarboxylate transporter receptor subunit TctC